jgi:hypothetical protein
MTGRLGGKRSPIEPDTVRSPMAKSSGYRSASSTGSSRPPSARMVTPDAPVNDVKNAKSTVVTIAVPPGSQPKSVEKTSSRRPLAPPAART